MTNEQLRVLLNWIASSLEAETYRIKEQLVGIEGLERKPNFYKDGEYYGNEARMPWPTTTSLEEFAEEQGLEIRYDGDLIILRELYAIINMLRAHERILSK